MTRTPKDPRPSSKACSSPAAFPKFGDTPIKPTTTSDQHDSPPKRGFAVRHARDASWDDGLRGFFAYRDLGVATATGGRIGAHVIRARGASTEPGEKHRHALEFQLVYVLRGWVEFDYDGVGRVRLEAGSSVVQPPGITHAELAHSEDLEMLEITLPARFETEPAV